MRKFSILVLVFGMLLGFSSAVLVTPVVYAAPDATTDKNKITISKDDLGLNDAPTSLGGKEIANLLNTVYFVAGMVAVAAMIYSGVKYTTANGESDKIQSAKNIMFYGVIGLVVIIMATAITTFISAGVEK